MDKIAASQRRHDMFTEAERLNTFKNWVFDDYQKCNAKNMAEGGFFFIGNDNEPDSVQCFMCGKALDGWEPNDDPWEEHCRHSAACPFVRNKMNEESYAANEYLELKETHIKLIADEIKDQIRDVFRTIKKTLFQDQLKEFLK